MTAERMFECRAMAADLRRHWSRRPEGEALDETLDEIERLQGENAALRAVEEAVGAWMEVPSWPRQKAMMEAHRAAAEVLATRGEV